MNRICVMCPSRDRPQVIGAAISSMLATSHRTSIIVYVDQDQEGSYLTALSEFHPAVDQHYRGQPKPISNGNDRVKVMVGKQVGPVFAANTIAHLYREPFTIYGMIPDDAVFVTPAWDDYLESEFQRAKGRIAVVAAAHNGGDYVNFPWVSREWIESIGWYYYPYNFHHCCDTVLEIIAECANAMVYAPREKFEMRHEMQHTLNREKFPDDANNFLTWCVSDRRELVKRVRNRMAEAR